MESKGLFDAVCRAMHDPAFYPHPVAQVTRKDTHISTIFLTGHWVYKLKKPLDFEFLDYRSLSARRRFCRLEVGLNQRLSRGVYRPVVGIRSTGPGSFALQGDGPIVEYAVRMVQLSEADSLRSQLVENRISPERVEALGKRLADFYREGRRSPRIDRYGRHDVIAFNMEENFRQLDPFAGLRFDAQAWEFLRQASRAFLAYRRDVFAQRIRDGRIRDGHGDLRADHVYFQGDVLQIIDCIEFNRRFRYGDVAVDLAFLFMDMEHWGDTCWSRRLMRAYARRAEDPGIYALVDFYAAYRAVVRLKVACLQHEQVPDGERPAFQREVNRWMDQAYRYALQFARPTLWVIHGPIASGKSTLARQLAQALTLPVFQTDRLRKASRPAAPPQVVPYGQGSYSGPSRNRVYARLFALAQETLKRGRSVVLDATFARRKWRAEARRLALDLDASVLFVACQCPRALIETRLRMREEAAGLSDARRQHLTPMLQEAEPPDELPPETRLAVDTGRPPAETLIEALDQGYARQCRQVAALGLTPKEGVTPNQPCIKT